MREPIFVPFIPSADSAANRPQTEQNARAEHRAADDRLMTIREAAAFVNVSRVRIDSAIETRELSVVELGLATRRIWRSDLEKWLDGKTSSARELMG